MVERNLTEIPSSLASQTSNGDCLSSLDDENDESPSIFGRLSETEAIQRITHLLPSFPSSGLTLDQLREYVLDSSKYEVWRNEVDQTPPRFTALDFRQIVSQQVAQYGSLIVNYHMSTLGQIPAGGHFSLVAGLARKEGEETGSEEWFVLLLDCWPETPVAWVPVENLVQAMNTPDRGNGDKFRGFLKRI